MECSLVMSRADHPFAPLGASQWPSAPVAASAATPTIVRSGEELRGRDSSSGTGRPDMLEANSTRSFPLERIQHPRSLRYTQKRQSRETSKQTPSVQNSAHDFNPQAYARGVMNNSACIDIHKKCVHNIKKCRHCHAIPLLNKDNKVVSFFVEHHRSDGRLITCSIGTGTLNHTLAQRRVDKNTPESGNDQIPIEVKIDESLQKMHLEGSVISEPTSIEHLDSTLGSQLEQVQTQMKASFSTPVVKQAARSLEQLVLLVIGLQFDTSLEAIVTRCVQFLSAITEGGIILTLRDSLMKYVANASMPDLLKGKTIKEAFEVEQSSMNQPEMLSAGSLQVWETLKQGIFTKHLSYILGTVFAFSACKIKNIKFNHPIYEKVVEHASSDEIDGMDLIDHAIKLYNWTSTVGMACLESRSLDPILINSSTLANCHAKYYEWHKKFLDFKREGKSSMEERQVMFVEVETIQKTLDKFVKTQKEKFITLQASSLYKEVCALYNDVRDFVQKLDRVKVAKAYHLNGGPKVGKSTFAPIVAEAMCLARGVEYRKEDNAQINLMAPYQDELNNATQIVTINETLPIKEHLAKSVENAYNTALALVDPVPYHPNRSNLEDKAKITMQHIGVISTGNTPQPFMHVAKTKGAWERRYPIIDMRVKKEFADDFGRLDSSKTDGTDDYHWYDVYEIVYQDDQRKVVYFEWEGKKSVDLTTPEVLELIRKQCMDHYAEQDKLDKAHNANKKKGCLTCKRLAAYCKCPNKDEHTLAGVKIETRETDADSIKDSELICPARTQVGPFRSPCKFHSGGICAFCGREEDDSSKNEPEMGLIQTAASTAGSLMWSSVLPWVNPFIKFKWLWSIDNNVMRCMHEELVEELSYWPETIGCSVFSLIPRKWEIRRDGSLTWFGKRKDQFLRMVAAEKQIFLPLSYLFRRALIWGVISFMILLSFGRIMENFGLNPRAYETIEFRTREYLEFGWYYPYPQYSEYVFERRELYADFGVYTEKYLDWHDFYVNIYFFEKILGRICFPWYFWFTRVVPVLVIKEYDWWLMPTIMSVLVTITLFFVMWWRRAVGFRQRYEDLKARSMSDPHFQKEIYEKSRRHCSEYNPLVPTAVGVIGAVVTGLVIWNSMRQPEVELGEKRTSWNDWFSFNRVVPEPFLTKNSSSDECQNILAKSLTNVEATVDGHTRRVIGVYLEPGVLLLPRHFFKKDPYSSDILSELDLFMETNGVRHKTRVYEKSMVQISGKDAVIIKVAKAPKLARSIAYMLPKKSGTNYIKGKLLYLLRTSGKPIEFIGKPSFEVCKEDLSCLYENDVDCAGFSVGRGLSYVSRVTKEGFCGCPIIADRKDGSILGFHIAGKNNGLTSRKGYAQEITYEDYKAAKEKLELSPSYTNQPEMKDLKLTRLGVDLTTGEGPHPKTEMFKPGAMDDHPCMTVVGHNTNLPRYRSRVRKSALSPKIEKHFGEKCRWKSPDFKEPWTHHNKNLKRVAKGAWEVPPESLKWAFDDYWAQLLEALEPYMEAHPELCEALDLDKAINGVKDSRYMDPLKMKTSAGIPDGTKESSGVFEQMPDYPDGRKRWKFSSMAQKYYDEMMASFDRGEGIGVYVRTCLKDEVVAEDSEKVRIFYILECVFAVACRQYYLPVAEFLSRHPLTSECMVGVNCAGPEWEVLVKHINELATDGKLNDWDFSGYDLCRPPDVMCASTNIQKKIGETMQYSEKSLKRMAMIGEELRCPMVNWNGTLVFLYLWCSGNTMTVYGNSIENSLHQRISFHWNGTRLRGDDFYKLGKYRDNEHIATYGDDGHAGSKPEVRDITTFSSRKMYFDMIGMGFTDARKGETAEETVPAEDVDFLKRQSVYHEALGLRVGALNKESIWKMGHMSSGVGEDEDLAIASMQSMLHESFLHGEEFYEYIRSGLQNCAKDCGFWTRELDIPFTEKSNLWLEKYGS